MAGQGRGLAGTDYILLTSWIQQGWWWKSIEGQEVTAPFLLRGAAWIESRLGRSYFLLCCVWELLIVVCGVHWGAPEYKRFSHWSHLTFLGSFTFSKFDFIIAMTVLLCGLKLCLYFCMFKQLNSRSSTWMRLTDACIQSKAFTQHCFQINQSIYIMRFGCWFTRQWCFGALGSFS